MVLIRYGASREVRGHQRSSEVIRGHEHTRCEPFQFERQSRGNQEAIKRDVTWYGVSRSHSRGNQEAIKRDVTWYGVSRSHSRGGRDPSVGKSASNISEAVGSLVMPHARSSAAIPHSSHCARLESIW